MRILFDQGTPVPLRRHLTQHEVATAFELGWAELTDAELLEAAEDGGFEVLVTTDQNLRYQQDLTRRRLAVIVLSTTSWPRIRRAVPLLLDLLPRMEAGSYWELRIPF